jgi:hypothetical protein
MSWNSEGPEKPKSVLNYDDDVKLLGENKRIVKIKAENLLQVRKEVLAINRNETKYREHDKKTKSATNP